MSNAFKYNSDVEKLLFTKNSNISSSLYLNRKLRAIDVKLYLNTSEKSFSFIQINNLKRFFLKYTYKNANTIIAQTDEMKDEFIRLGLSDNKIKVLHNFIDEELIINKANELSPFPKDSAVRFVSVGRIAHQKGFDILIKAFKKVVNEIQDSKLYIIGSFEGGDQSVYHELMDLIIQFNLKDKVIFTGYTENPYKYIKNASVYVLSSRYEGLPNVLIESQFLKIPSAATSCIPIISRMVKDGINGYLANNEDPDSLAKAMINASKLNHIDSIYKPSKKEDFINLFY